jgi:hypothetical protein
LEICRLHRIRISDAVLCGLKQELTGHLPECQLIGWAGSFGKAVLANGSDARVVAWIRAQAAISDEGEWQEEISDRKGPA